MENITKQDIKEVFVETLEPFANSVKEEFDKVHKKFDTVDKRFDTVEQRLDKVEYDLTEVKTDVKWMKDNSSALFTKLDKFIALYEKQEHELLILNEHFKKLEERVVRLEGQILKQS